MSAYTHLLDSGIRWAWHDKGLAAALDRHARWFLCDHSLWAPRRTAKVYQRIAPDVVLMESSRG